MFAGKKSAQIREILISESAWEEMTCLFAPSLTCRRRSVSAAIISLLVFCAAAKSHHRQGSPVNGCYRVYPEHQSKLKCPHVGYVSAFAEDVFTPGLKLLQGFQHVVMVQTSL